MRSSRRSSTPCSARPAPSGPSPASTGTTTRRRVRCVGCGVELFGADTKFDTGSGWPGDRPGADIGREIPAADAATGDGERVATEREHRGGVRRDAREGRAAVERAAVCHVVGRRELEGTRSSRTRCRLGPDRITSLAAARWARAGSQGRARVDGGDGEHRRSLRARRRTRKACDASDRPRPDVGLAPQPHDGSGQ